MRYVILFCVCFNFQAQAWMDMGHMVIAQIAWNHLTPEARKNVNRWSSKIPFTEGFLEMMPLACQMDVIKKQGLQEFSSWHYINQPYVTGPHIQWKPYAEDNVVWAIKQAKATIESPDSTSEGKGWSLMMLLHFVGDIHQPLHACNRFDDTFPEGDQGGALFAVKPISISGEQLDNIHLIWDAAGGLYPMYKQKTYDKHRHEIKYWAEYLDAKHGHDVFSVDFAPDLWAQESYQVAVHQVYYGVNPSESLSKEYIQNVKRVSGKRLVQAGLRLAEMLNSLSAL